MTTSLQPGWYDDPQDTNSLRYWDGQNWTQERQPKPVAQPSQPPPPTGSPVAGPVGPPPHPGAAAPTGSQTPAVNFSTVQGAVKQLGPTAWLLIGGFVAAFISVFLTWFTVTTNVSVAGMDIYSTTGKASTSSAGKFMVLLPLAGAAWLAWPLFTGTVISVRRLTGLTAVVGLLVALVILIWLVNGSSGNSDVKVSPGFGLLLCATAAIVMTVGVIQLWRSRSKPQSLIS